jgi:hypothetical protein
VRSLTAEMKTPRTDTILRRCRIRGAFCPCSYRQRVLKRQGRNSIQIIVIPGLGEGHVVGGHIAGFCGRWEGFWL